MCLMEFDRVLNPWKLTTKNNTEDERIIRRGKVFATFSCLGVTDDKAVDRVLTRVSGFNTPTSVVMEDGSTMPGSLITVTAW